MTDPAQAPTTETTPASPSPQAMVVPRTKLSPDATVRLSRNELGNWISVYVDGSRICQLAAVPGHDSLLEEARASFSSFAPDRMVEYAHVAHALGVDITIASIKTLVQMVRDLNSRLSKAETELRTLKAQGHST